MSKPSAGTKVPSQGYITRKQQVKVLKELKAQEIGENVADRIREAVKQEVNKQLKPVTDTMMDLIDRVLVLETHQAKTFAPGATVESGTKESATVLTSGGRTQDEDNSASGHAGEETPEVSVDDQVVPGPSSEGPDPPDPGETGDPV